MIDRKWIGHRLFDATFNVERGRVRQFSQAIGETNPIYLDEAAARAAGHPDVLAPPTFLFAAELDSGGLFGWLAEAGVPLTRVLHGEQRFAYHRQAHAGDVLRVSTRIADVYAKRGGALEFVIVETRVADREEQPVAELTGTIVVRS